MIESEYKKSNCKVENTTNVILGLTIIASFLIVVTIFIISLN